MKAMYAGSFNPFHIGHNYVYQEACKIFDEVILAIPRKHKGNQWFDEFENREDCKMLLDDVNFEVVLKDDVKIEI